MDTGYRIFEPLRILFFKFFQGPRRMAGRVPAGAGCIVKTSQHFGQNFIRFCNGNGPPACADFRIVKNNDCTVATVGNGIR